MPTWMTALVFVSILAVIIAVAVWIDSCVQRNLLIMSQERPGRMAGLVVVLHLAILGLWAIVGVGAVAVAESADSHLAAAWLIVPLLLITGPVTMCFMPGEYDGFRSSRRDMRKLGAPESVGRAMYWTGFPFMLLELMLAIGSLFACFLD